MRKVLSDHLGSKPDPVATTHAGLWLDKYLPDFGDPAKKELVEAKKELVEQVAKRIISQEVYLDFYQRWLVSLKRFGGDFKDNQVVLKRAEVRGRLAINLGAESLIETSISLHRTYGVPYIPGSALKGLAAHYARNHLQSNDWKAAGAAYPVLFGDQDQAGAVIFFDALLVPKKNFSPLVPDVVTVHHPEYYRGDNSPPADWDSPIPIHFLTATGEFLIALSGPADWVGAALNILRLALEHEGIGAKTSSGYGRMLLEA